MQTRANWSISHIHKKAVVSTVYYSAWNVMSIAHSYLLFFVRTVFAVIFPDIKLKILMSSRVDVQENSVFPFPWKKMQRNIKSCTYKDTEK